MEQQENNIQQQQQNSQTFKVMGMKTDLSESSFENSFAFENKNMRINTVDDDNTLMNLTNERGTVEICGIDGIPIGMKKFANDKVLLVTTTNEGGVDVNRKEDNGIDINAVKTSDDIVIGEFSDSFYMIGLKDNKIECSKLKSSSDKSIGFSARNPLEIEHYNDGDKDFFYIADGLNNFKALCIEDNYVYGSNTKLEYNNPHVTGSEDLRISSSESSNGEFFAGAMVYCFAYVNRLGHKTGIIDVSDIIYLTNYQSDHGLEPNKRCNIINEVYLSNLSTEFTGVEIYSLFRSSLNGEIVCRKVATNITRPFFSVKDYNKGEIISYQELITRTNTVIIPGTLTTKSNSLFLGNITTNNYGNLNDIIRWIGYQNNVEFTVDNNSFLKDNQYFYGVQFQDHYGNWSPAIYIGTKYGNVSSISISSSICTQAFSNGYIAARALILDNKRIRNTICEGVVTHPISLMNSKYGIDIYSNYFYDLGDEEIKTWRLDNDFYNGFNIVSKVQGFSDFYSPDIDFDGNLIVDNNNSYKLVYYKNNKESLLYHNISVEINGNTGVLYNSTYNRTIGKASISGYNYVWNDSIEGYHKALTLLVGKENREKDIGDDLFLSLYDLQTKYTISEKPTEYKLYTWQPSGSLNDSNGKTSVLRTKRISRKYIISNDCSSEEGTHETSCWMYDGTTNNIPIVYTGWEGEEEYKDIKVYAGTVNHKIYPDIWSLKDDSNNNRLSNFKNGEKLWDDNQIALCEGYSLSTLTNFSYVGQPIEIVNKRKGVVPIWDYPALSKVLDDGFEGKIYLKTFVRTSSLGEAPFAFPSDDNNYYSKPEGSKNRSMYSTLESYLRAFEPLPENENDPNGSADPSFPIKIRTTTNFNRNGSVNFAYRTSKHLVVRTDNFNLWFGNFWGRLVKRSNDVQLSDSDIETGSWVICSKKSKIELNKGCSLDVNINEAYKWDEYECLKTEPYSLSDENQVTCCLGINGVHSYMNPMCRYDNLRNISDFNGITSSIFNKMNIVYNQKNNFFSWAGITENTVTDDTLDNTILFSDVKVQNEKEDTFVNFNSTNFYTIDNSVKKINKLLNYNDKLLCFSDNSIVQILYNENVVINTESVDSLGLASTDVITGTQLITNTYGCLNKWSMGIYNNILYFNDDLNNKIISFSSDGFGILNETLGIETLNSKLLMNNAWNPVDFCNTKLNIDKYSKDVHYTSKDIDIALNTSIGFFSSLYSYESIPFIDTVGKHSVAIRKTNNRYKLYSLREGEYNYFFGKYEPYWTIVIVNQNSLINKTLRNIEFNTEAYSKTSPIHDFTFDTVSLWNDYQKNDMEIDYRMYGKSTLKKKFRLWRVNMLRNESRMVHRNYDMISNPWSYMKLSCQKENTNKLTLHYININYK